MAQILLRLFAGILAMLLAASAVAENEIFPNVHSEPITIRVVSGQDGRPVANARLILVAGYTKRDLQLQMWHDVAFTDINGKVQLSSAIANLPFLRISIAKKHLCVGASSGQIFSIDQIRRDGLSTPNGCGIITISDTPGLLVLYIKNKVVDPPTFSSPTPPVTVANSAAPRQTGCRRQWFSCCASSTPPLPPVSSLR